MGGWVHLSHDDLEDNFGRCKCVIDRSANHLCLFYYPLSRIPWLGDERKEDQARRLVTFIDLAYENCRALFCTAEVPVEALFKVVGEEVGQKSESASTYVTGKGGSSGRSTTMIGEMEWSATGQVGASLARLKGVNTFTQRASRRTVSRLLEMSSESYLEKDDDVGRKILHWLSAERDS